MSGDVLGLLKRVIDQLRFDEMVEEGGFGYVYRGVHLGLDEPVAIKCLKTRAGDDPELADSFSKRFRDETKIAYRLSQGNLDIVRSISSGTLTTPSGMHVPYMVLEWLEGHTLTAELFDRRESGQPRTSLIDAVRLLDSAAGAVGFAHTQGVVHRDLKPGNLFLADTRTGPRLKVLDFGLAKIVDPDGFMAPSGAQTGANVFIASPSYGAPEQFSKKHGAIGPWTDVYSFALVMLEVLVGKKVRHADNIVDGMVLALQEESACPTPRKLGIDVTDEVEAVFKRATSLDAARRFKDLNELWAALRDAMMSMPDARDELETIAAHEGSATLEARDRVIAEYDAKEREREKKAISQSAATKLMPVPTGSQPSVAPSLDPRRAIESTQRLSTQTPLPLSNMSGSRTVPLAQNFQAIAALPLTPKAVQGPPSPRAHVMTPAPLSTPHPPTQRPIPSQPGFAPPLASLARMPTAQSPRPQKKRAPIMPLWAALLIAAVIGAFGAFALVYAIKTKK